MITVTDDSMTAEEFRQFFRAENRARRIAAKAFADACAGSDAEELYQAVDLLNETTVDGWRPALKRVARLTTISPVIQQAFIRIWIESKMLPLSVGDRRTLARGLCLLLPGGYSGPPLTLYRGASWRERRRRLYGFSWTTDKSVARTFAEHWQRTDKSSGAGLVLKTTAPNDAVLLVDALGLIGQLLDTMLVGVKPKAPEKPKNISGYVAWSPAAVPLDWMAL
jgi:hypothetical protein